MPQYPRVIRVIESLTTKGKGTAEEPYRTVREYHTLDGVFLADSDKTFLTQGA